MGVARFNIAHGSLESHERALKNLREVLAETQSLCATLVSLQGFNLRTGSTENDAVIQLVARQLFTWRCAPGDARLLTTERSGYINCAYLPAAVKPGFLCRARCRFMFVLCVC
jgi:pyruvate kinase